MFKNHPKGLPVLFFTEMWERFGFYLILGIFVLYMQAGPDPVIAGRSGLGLPERDAKDIYGSYLALVYLTPFVGGLLADRVLGYRRAIIIGGLLMGGGYCGLAIPGMGVHFYLSLLMIIVGNGFFKPNISTLVGNLYNDPRYREQKDAGFNIFYMGINIGALVCNFVAAFLRLNYGWGYAFLAAGIGMFIGVAWFLAGQKHTIAADVMKPAIPGDQPVGRILAQVFVPAFAFAAIGWFLPTAVFGLAPNGDPSTIFGSRSNDAFLFACIPVVWFYASLWRRARGEDRERIGAILPVCAAVIAFWAIFHQNGASLTDWAENYTRREMPASVASAADQVGLVQEVNTGVREVKVRDGHGDIVLDAKGAPKTAMGPDPYFNNVPQAERPPPPPAECMVPKLGDEQKAKCSPYSVKLMSSELFQSVNAGFVVLLTPLVVGVFAWLRRRRKEPSTPGKIASGMFITALSTLFMVAAALVTHNGAEKGSAMWLVGAYFVVTVGELCLSPMGLSMVSKLSPPRLTALMMGAWFLSTSIGNKFAGILSAVFNAIETKAWAFGINCVFALASCGLIVLMLPRLKRVMDKYLG